MPPVSTVMVPMSILPTVRNVPTFHVGVSAGLGNTSPKMETCAWLVVKVSPKIKKERVQVWNHDRMRERWVAVEILINGVFFLSLLPGRGRFTF